MKKIFPFLSILISISFSSYGQWDWTIDFEDPAVFDRIFIDTNANPNNIWEIGEPEKLLFNSAHSPTHVIITDSLNPYPINDTSSFIITHIREGGWGGNTLLLLDFYFKIDSDTLTDYGMIELSIDKGLTWFDLMALDLNWIEPKPVLTGTIPSWTHFSVDLSNITYNIGYSDTLLYKFSFISDNNQTNKEGWMIDDFLFEDYWEGIEEHRNDNLISIYPNPASDYLSLERKNYGNNETIEVMDLKGRIILSIRHFKGETLDITSLKAGIYLLKYSDTETVAIKPFAVIP